MSQTNVGFPVFEIIGDDSDKLFRASMTSSSASETAGIGSGALVASANSANRVFSSNGVNVSNATGILFATGVNVSATGYTLQLLVDSVWLDTSFSIDKKRYLASRSGAGGTLESQLTNNRALLLDFDGASSIDPSAYPNFAIDDKPNQTKVTIVQDPVTYSPATYGSVFIDDLEVMTAPTVNASTVTDWYIAGLTASDTDDGVNGYSVKNAICLKRPQKFPQSKLRSVGFLGSSFIGNAGPSSYFSSKFNKVRWIPRGKSGGAGYTAGDALTTAFITGAGTGATFTIAANGVGIKGDIMQGIAGGLGLTLISGGSGYAAGDWLRVIGGTGGGAKIQVSAVSAGVITSFNCGNGAGYQQNSLLASIPVSAANFVLNQPSRCDTGFVAQVFRQLSKSGHWPTENANFAESGGFLVGCIGTTAATGRAYKCGFAAMKDLDGTIPELMIINIGTNEAAGASGASGYVNFQANYRTLLIDMDSSGVGAVIIQNILSLAIQTGSNYHLPPYPQQVIDLNAIIAGLPAWAASTGLKMKVIVQDAYTEFGGATPNVGLFQTGNIHPNSAGSSKLGILAGQAAASTQLGGASSSGGLLSSLTSSLLG
jgi:hypothetical protein